MMKIWAKEFKDNHLIKDIVVNIDNEDTRTHKIFEALEIVCNEFDLAKPIWLDVNINEFKRMSKTRFTRDSFVEEIDFDYLEFHIIEE